MKPLFPWRGWHWRGTLRFVWTSLFEFVVLINEKIAVLCPHRFRSVLMFCARSSEIACAVQACPGCLCLKVGSTIPGYKDCILLQPFCGNPDEPISIVYSIMKLHATTCLFFVPVSWLTSLFQHLFLSTTPLYIKNPMNYSWNLLGKNFYLGLWVSSTMNCSILHRSGEFSRESFESWKPLKKNGGEVQNNGWGPKWKYIDDTHK